MKLGLVGPLPPPNGGMAMQTEQLARLLALEGVEVELLPTNAPYRPVWVERVRGLRALFRLFPFLVRVWSLAGRVDLVHLMANSGWSWQLFAAPVIWLCRWRGTPVVVNYRGGKAEEYLARSAQRVLPTLRRASELVVPSGFLKDVFGRHGIDSVVVPNIIDSERFAPVTRLWGEHMPLRLVVTRNLEPIYGLETAIHALAIVTREIPAAHLTLAGSGPSGDSLRELAGELGVGDQVQFSGRLDRQQIASLYTESHIMLNPTRVDNMPNSVLEAMACGLPVISTDVGGVPYILRHEHNGLLVPVDDPEAMAAAILRLVRDPALGRALAETGLRQVQQYTWPVVRDQWLALYTRQREEAA